MDFLAVFSGFAVGAIVGVTGVGGGSLMTPLLMSVFKLSPALASAPTCGLPPSPSPAAPGRITGMAM
jgi:uncharacterized membrane protein YfcA